jgi:hypothetical protein
LNAAQLLKYADGKNPFGDISINFAREEIDENLYPKLFEIIISNVTVKKKDPVFNSLWLIIEKRFSSSVGSILFKGEPGKDGQVEIGYGTHEEFQNRGYMTEAAGALCDWVLKNTKAKKIIAETEKNNPASFSVLEKNGFQKFDENKKFYYWKLEVGRK